MVHCRFRTIAGRTWPGGTNGPNHHQLGCISPDTSRRHCRVSVWGTDRRSVWRRRRSSGSTHGSKACRTSGGTDIRTGSSRANYRGARADSIEGTREIAGDRAHAV